MTSHLPCLYAKSQSFIRHLLNSLESRIFELGPQSARELGCMMLSLMIALYLAQDSFGTACNVTGDGAITVLADKLTGKDSAPERAKQLQPNKRIYNSSYYSFQPNE